MSGRRRNGTVQDIAGRTHEKQLYFVRVESSGEVIRIRCRGGGEARAIGLARTQLAERGISHAGKLTIVRDGQM